VLKYPRVLQTLFYLLRTPKETVCERATNKLQWKYAKDQLAD
jgi:hypothetical protein